jgi:capsular polysaccharide biosynthesis protein
VNDGEGKNDSAPVIGYFVSLPATPVGDAFSWIGIVRALWKYKLLITLVSVFLGVAFWWLGSFVKPTYRAESVVALVEQDGASVSPAVSGQLGRLASMAGFNLGGTGSGRQELWAVLSSRSLYATYIGKEELLPVLFPARWDASSKKWLEVDGESAGAPTLDQGIEKLRRSILKVVMDRDTGLVKISAEHADPDTAARLVNGLIRVGNEEVRAKVANEATGSLAFLEKEMSLAQDVETRQLIAQLMQRQISTRMLTSVRSDYAYKVVDPAFRPDPDRYIRPRRALYAALGLFLGFLVSSLWVVCRKVS